MLVLGHQTVKYLTVMLYLQSLGDYLAFQSSFNFQPTFSECRTSKMTSNTCTVRSNACTVWPEPIWIKVKKSWQIPPQHQSTYLGGPESVSIEISHFRPHLEVLLLNKFGSERRDFNWCRFLASCVLGSSLISTCQILNIECLLLFSSGRRSWKNQNKYIFQIPNSKLMSLCTLMLR